MTKTIGRNFAVLMLTAMSLGAVACSQEPTRDDFVQEADQICRSAEQRLRDLEQPQSLDELDAFVDEARSEMNQLISELREVEAPENLQGRVDTMITNLQGTVDEFGRLVTAAQEQDTAQIEEINRSIEEKVSAANEAARDIGLEECGSTSPTGE